MSPLSRRDQSRWLLAHTESLLQPLVFSTVARIAGQLIGVALLVVAVEAVVRQWSIGGTIALLVVMALIKAALRYLEHFSGHHVAFTALQRLRELYFASLVPQAPAATQGEAGAELTERGTRDIDRIEVFFAHTFPPAISAAVVAVISLEWLAFTVDAASAGILAAFAVAMVAIPVLFGRSAWREARQVSADRGELVARVGDDFQGVGEVLALDAREARLAGLDAAEDRLQSSRRQVAARQGARQGMLTAMALYFVAALTQLSTTRSPAELAVALAVAVGLWTPLRGVDDFVTGLDAAFAATARVREVIDRRPVVTNPRQPTAFTPGDVDLDNVVLVFDRRLALDDVSATWPQGRWSYVCGVSGSGKSSLASLLLRDRDPELGTVRIGGTDVRDLALDDLRGRVVIADQRPTMLPGTVADNLRLGAPTASDERLRSALDDVALDLALGSRIGERGTNVSGGQLARLAIARALVTEPDVLILDEALSQLDEATAEKVRAKLAGKLPGLTIIEITHRADLVPDDAPVVVLDLGQVVDPVEALRKLRNRE